MLVKCCFRAKIHVIVRQWGVFPFNELPMKLVGVPNISLISDILLFLTSHCRNRFKGTAITQGGRQGCYRFTADAESSIRQQPMNKNYDARPIARFWR